MRRRRARTSVGVAAVGLILGTAVTGGSALGASGRGGAEASGEGRTTTWTMVGADGPEEAATSASDDPGQSPDTGTDTTTWT